MNVLGTTNAKKGPKEDYNSYREYCDKELDGHILAAAMTHFEMTNVTGNFTNVVLKSYLSTVVLTLEKLKSC